MKSLKSQMMDDITLIFFMQKTGNKTGARLQISELKEKLDKLDREISNEAR